MLKQRRMRGAISHFTSNLINWYLSLMCPFICVLVDLYLKSFLEAQYCSIDLYFVVETGKKYILLQFYRPRALVRLLCCFRKKRDKRSDRKQISCLVVKVRGVHGWNHLKEQVTPPTNNILLHSSCIT